MGVLSVPLWKSELAVWSTGTAREWNASSPCVSRGGHQADHQGQLSGPVWGSEFGVELCLPFALIRSLHPVNEVRGSDFLWASQHLSTHLPV